MTSMKNISTKKRNKMQRTMILLRGVPGSGKSTYAQKLMERLNSMFGLRVIKCSADDYFIDIAGNYNFDRTKLGSAHGQCKFSAAKGCRSGNDLVVIDNTNTTHKEMKPYKEIAKEYGYRVLTRVIGDLDGESIKVYAKRNIHGVSLEAIQRMADRFAK